MPPTDTFYLEATGLFKRFGNSIALDGVSLRVGEGEALALLGPSGCGKTTLLRVLSGLETPDAGTVVVNGETLTGPGTNVPPEKRRIGMVFQDWAVFPHLTVAKNVAYGLTEEQIAAGRVKETLEMVGMSAFADRHPDALSGGELQRVAVARALAPRPRLLLFDEPFSNLDTELRIKVRADIARLMREVHMTSVFVTHDQEEAFVLGDCVAVMRRGKIEQEGRPAEIYENPATPWLATFVGDANLLDATANGNVASTAIGDLRLIEPRQGACRVLVRPEHLLIGNGDDAVVSAVEFYGHDTAYEVMLDGTRLLARGIAAPRFATGDRVSVTYSGPDVVAYAPHAVNLPLGSATGGVRVP